MTSALRGSTCTSSPAQTPAMIAPASADALATQHRPGRDQRLHRAGPGAALDPGPQRVAGQRLGDAQHPERGPGQQRERRAASRS